jgi:hypothetical protein
MNGVKARIGNRSILFTIPFNLKNCLKPILFHIQKMMNRHQLVYMVSKKLKPNRE